MNKTDRRYQMYLDILQEELLPALGCTEPIAVAYAAANARSVLPGAPERLEVAVSNNIVKNVKSVIVPNTGGLKGIQAAAAIGAVAGNEKLALEVISSVTERDRESLRKFLAEKEILVKPAESTDVFDIRVDAFDGEGNHGVCRIQKTHTNVTLLAKNDVILLRRDDAQSDRQLANREMLSVEGILDFAQTCELEELKADGQVHSDCGCQDQKRPSPQPVGNRHHDVDDKHILPPK